MGYAIDKGLCLFRIGLCGFVFIRQPADERRAQNQNSADDAGYAHWFMEQDSRQNDGHNRVYIAENGDGM